MELITIEITKDNLQMLLDSGALADYKVKEVKVPDFDYSESEAWKKQKAKADKAYKELKKIEYELRHDKARD